MLGALQEHEQPPVVAQALLRAAFPGTVVEEGGAFAGLQQLTPAQQEALTNALHAAAGQLLEDAQAVGQGAMAYSLAGHGQAAAATLLDAVFWLAEQKPAPVDPGLPAQLLEQVHLHVDVEDVSGGVWHGCGLCRKLAAGCCQLLPSPPAHMRALSSASAQLLPSSRLQLDNPTQPNPTQPIPRRSPRGPAPRTAAACLPTWTRARPPSRHPPLSAPPN